MPQQLSRFSALAASLINPCCDTNLEPIPVATGTALQPIYSEQLRRRRILRMPPTTRRASRAQQARASSEASTPPVQLPSLTPNLPPINLPPINIDRQNFDMQESLTLPPISIDRQDVHMPDALSLPLADEPSPRITSNFPSVPHTPNGEEAHEGPYSDDDRHLEIQIHEAIYRQASIYEIVHPPGEPSSSSSSDEDETEETRRRRRSRPESEAGEYAQRYQTEADAEEDGESNADDAGAYPGADEPEIEILPSSPRPQRTSESTAPGLSPRDIYLFSADQLNRSLPLDRHLPPVDERPAISYMCGNTSPETKWVQESPSKHFIGWVQGCEEVSKIREGEPMRCKTCGSRVLYKMRTKRMVQFEAR